MFCYVGTGLIFVAVSDVDKTGASYYGEQHIYLMLTNGEGFKLPLGIVNQNLLIFFISAA